MPRLVCLYIEDNDVAEELLTVIAADQNRLDVGGVSMSVTPVALFAVPTLECECPKNDVANPIRTTRGEKYGWWVHRVCGKPVPNGWQSPRNLLIPLQPEVHARERTYSKIYVSWTFQPPLIPQTQTNSSMPYA
jgi:hypothetical protein